MRLLLSRRPSSVRLRRHRRRTTARCRQVSHTTVSHEKRRPPQQVHRAPGGPCCGRGRCPHGRRRRRPRHASRGCCLRRPAGAGGNSYRPAPVGGRAAPRAARRTRIRRHRLGELRVHDAPLGPRSPWGRGTAHRGRRVSVGSRPVCLPRAGPARGWGWAPAVIAWPVLDDTPEKARPGAAGGAHRTLPSARRRALSRSRRRSAELGATHAVGVCAGGRRLAVVPNVRRAAPARRAGRGHGGT
jgi:hypothetical protein